MLPNGAGDPARLQSIDCCPACGTDVDGERGLSCHYGRSPCCAEQSSVPVPMEEDTLASAVQLDQATVYEDSTRQEVGNDLADWRFSKYIPSTTVETFKTKVRGWLQKAADELVRRLGEAAHAAVECSPEAVVALPMPWRRCARVQPPMCAPLRPPRSQLHLVPNLTCPRDAPTGPHRVGRLRRSSLKLFVKSARAGMLERVKNVFRGVHMCAAPRPPHPRPGAQPDVPA